MTPNKCQIAHDYAQAYRLEDPLPKGIYKLHDTANRLKRLQETVESIERLRARPNGRSPKSPISLGCCMSNEAGIWLKSVPAELSALLGKNYEPAVEALKADGVPAATVRRMHDRAQRETANLVDDCEEVRRSLYENGVKAEYEAIEAGCSRVGALLQTTLETVEAALDEAEIYARLAAA